MATQDTFKVSTKDHTGFTVTTDRKPQTLEEFESLNLVSKYPDDVIALAWQNWVIKAQSGARQRLSQGEEAVQKYIDEYKFGERVGGGFTRPKISGEEAKELKFTKAQLEALAKAGVKLEGIEV